MAASARYAAVLCLGAVVRGETSHDQHINRGVSLAISQIALQFDLPVLFGVLTCESMEQALDRAGGNENADAADFIREVDDRHDIALDELGPGA